uniref:FAD synthase n=1 Tax=Syphacia muris TaxID=451379 RepID=A0A0N5AAI8_9BILA
LEKIAVSFNGGKDCTVLLHLFRIAIDRKFGTKKRIQAIYINCHDSFPEISSFISETCGRYQIDLFEYPGPIKDGLQKLKENHPDISAIIMGSRSTDPHGIHMKSKRQWTDKGWPSYLRVFPIFDWSYSDVWHAIIGLRVQYCSLYDQGYTSLGDKRKTGKNDALKILDENGKVIGYRPAYELNIGSLERLGRNNLRIMPIL